MFYDSKMQLTKEVFQNPGKEYRGTPFWAWNCKMTEAEVDHIINTMKDMGMGGVHIHCRTGLKNPYLGEEFLQLVKYTNEKCKAYDMLTWLYDEDRWPSGAGGGYVTKNHEYRMRFLVFAPERQEKKRFEEEGLHSTGQAVRSNERVYLGRYQIKLENGYLADYAKVNEKELLEDGYQEWFAYMEISGDNPWFNNQAYLNTLDKKAVERFVEVTHEKYYAILKEEFGKSVPAIFTDEPQFSHKQTLGFAEDRNEVILPFTDDLEETFKAAYGHSLIEHLPELFWELGEKKVSRIRYEYHDHISERFTEAFADTIGAWCKEHGIMLTGHMMEEEGLRSQTAALGEAMRSYRSFELPGVDMLCDKRELSTVKQAQSAAHQYGRLGVLSEIYGVTNWDFDFRRHKLAGDWQAALGVTVRVPHLTWTSMEGEAKRDYPASIGYQSPWYKEYPLIENHFARVNSVLTRGTPHVRVGVIHPIESYWLYWGPKEQTEGIRSELDRQFHELIEWLLYGMVDFDFISESLLSDLNEGQKENQSLKVGSMQYDAILIPNCRTLRATTLNILESFVKRGGKVIFAGEPPLYEDAYPSDRGKKLAERTEEIPFGKVFILQSLEKYREIIIRDENGKESSNMIYQMRREGENRWLFLCHVKTDKIDPELNMDIPIAEHLRITIKGEWKLTHYNTMNGQIEEIGCEYEKGNTILYREMYAQDSFLLQMEPGKRERVFDKPQKEPHATDIKIPVKAEIILDEPNVSILDIAEYKFDDGDWQDEEEILKIDNKFRKVLGYPRRMEAYAQPWTNDREERFEHTLSLRYKIHAECNLNDIKLASELDEGARIFLDDREIPNVQTGWYTDHSIRTVILPEISRGEHVLMVEIPYNSRVNVEAMFLLGTFSVSVFGCYQTLEAAKNCIGYADMTRQGYPFYGGNLTYRIPFITHGGEVIVQASMYRAPLLSLKVDGESTGYIYISPYQVNIGKLNPGKHLLELTVYGSRINTFGCLHNCNQKEEWIGPNAWRTTGVQWSYEYQIKPMGLLKAPVLREVI